MKTKKHTKPVLLLLLVVLAVITTVNSVSVLAKYASTETAENDITLEYFDVGFTTTAGTPDENGIVTLTVSQYNDFQLIVNYKGDGKAFVRVLIEESWIKDAAGVQTVLIASGSPAYSYGTAVKNIGDGYLYLGPISGTKDITIISGVTATAPTGATHVKLSIKVEAVQYNRTNAFWGVAAADITP